jgi:excisionase family DNA binding protein
MKEKSMSPGGETDDLWNVDDVARYFKASRSWVYQQAEGGMLPCLRIGGLLRFEPAAVKAFARGERHLAKVLPLRGEKKTNDGG